ncbi:MAG: DUF3394 domain-containing protein, partial [Gammaproteobacteria bacterium]|nr:DUF3394 domain-containing protein [Gammaproteobacteria bacterium]
KLPGAEIYATAESLNDGQHLVLEVRGETLEGDTVEKIVPLRISAAAGDGVERVNETGLTLREEEGVLVVDTIMFGSQAEGQGIDFDWEIVSVVVPNDRPAKEWMFIPALLLLGFVAWLQKRRAGTPVAAEAA